MFTGAYLCGCFCSHSAVGRCLSLLQLCPILTFSCNQLSLNPFPKEQLQISFLSHICNSSIFVIPEATSVHTIFRLCCKHGYSTILKLSICPIERMKHTKVHDLKNQVTLQKQKPFLILNPLQYMWPKTALNSCDFGFCGHSLTTHLQKDF